MIQILMTMMMILFILNLKMVINIYMIIMIKLKILLKMYKKVRLKTAKNLKLFYIFIPSKLLYNLINDDEDCQSEKMVPYQTF